MTGEYINHRDSLENQEMSVNLIAVRELTRTHANVRELSGQKSCQLKLFIVNFIFGEKSVFSSIVVAQ